MDNKTIFTQVMDFQKNIFDNSYAMISNIQDQSEQLISKAIEKNPLVPNDTLKVCTYWMDIIKKNRKNYKSYVDTNFVKVKDMLKINEPVDMGNINK
ncbi:MAG: hypothetical protein HQK73_07730 [Desulfamplus sp.]|nr:hypothetical protein [Desulfamplus sp.]MBF0413109.1 hypothetical protein [Desulfamplus sp.]